MADILASVAGVRLAGLPFAGGPRCRPAARPVESTEMHTAGKPAGRKCRRGCLGSGGTVSPAGNCTLTASARGAGDVFQRCWSAPSLGGRRSWHRLDYGGFQVVADILGRFGVF